METWADDLIEIADDASGDYIDRVAADGTIEHVVDPETVQRSKLRMDARKWIMARLAARTYGDKLDLNLSATVEVGALSDAELEARTKARLKALGVEIAGPLLRGRADATGAWRGRGRRRGRRQLVWSYSAFASEAENVG